jgi:hypothetical protein
LLRSALKVEDEWPEVVFDFEFFDWIAAEFAGLISGGTARLNIVIDAANASAFALRRNLHALVANRCPPQPATCSG